MGNLEKAQKAFAFFISSSGAESSVAFGKLSQLGVSLDDVAYQNSDGSWMTRYGSIPFSMGSGSSDSVVRDQQKHEQKKQSECESSQKAEQEEIEHREREASRDAKRWSREYDQNKKREQAAERKHYDDIIAHANDQAVKHEAFGKGEGYIGSDGEYHLFSEMKWSV